MKEFKLWVELRGGYYTNVEANNLNEAIDIAIANADPFEMTIWDCDAEEA